MKNTVKSTVSMLSAFILLIAAAGCTHETDGLEEATYPATAEVFIDAFPADLEYAAFGEGSDIKAFDVDTKEKYKGTSSMKIAVPDENNPNGSWAGGAYYSTFGRDLSGYNCLTFWAKATQWASINEIGFGVDMGESKYKVFISGVAVNTNWKKYCIPVPNPAKLKSEKGMFFFSGGPENGRGYTFWIDEVKFENLETITNPQPKILNGADSVISLFIGVTITIGNGSETFNLPDGTTREITVSASYFDFSSSDETVATVSNEGVITVHGSGTATISAKVNGVEAAGTLTVNPIEDDFEHAPQPPDMEVISIFSDAYDNVPVDFFNGYWEPYQTTQLSVFKINGDSVLSYTDFNFVGNGFPPIDASGMSHIHFDVFVPAGTTDATLRITLRDFGPNDKTGEGGSDDDDTDFSQTFAITSGEWIGLDMPIESMVPRNKVCLIIYEGNLSLRSFYLDNIYFYKQE